MRFQGLDGRIRCCVTNEGTYRGFTLIELLVVIAIISLLAAILFPVFSRARENARRTSCLSNAKQISMGVIMYSQDYDEYVMPTYLGGYFSGGPAYWPYLTLPYTKSQQIFNCPSEPGAKYSATEGTYGWNTNTDYGMNAMVNLGLSGSAPKMSVIAKPSETIMVCETTNGWRSYPKVGAYSTYTTSDGAPPYRHLATTVVGFYDGHAKAMRQADIEKNQDTEDGTNLAAIGGAGGWASYIYWNRF